MSVWKCAVAGVAVAVVAASAFGAEDFPAGARGFAGMLSGKVVSKGGNELVIKVTAIEKTWKHNKAEKPESLVGQQVTMRIKPEIYKKKEGYVAKVRKFFDLLKVDDVEKFDCRHDEGNELTFLELTKEQLERVGGEAAEPPKGEKTPAKKGKGD